MSTQDESRLSVLEERVKNWMDTTIDYRKSLCEKINELKVGQDKIFVVLDSLPCDKRSGYYQAISRQLKFMWGVLAGVLVGIIHGWIKK